MKKILFIEDNLEIRENTAELLVLHGFDVSTANNGQLGLSLVSEISPDVVLCDIQMPELSGYDVFRAMKENASTAAIPFVFVTASAERSEVQAGLDMGAAGYVRKPFEINELLDAIRMALVQQ